MLRLFCLRYGVGGQMVCSLKGKPVFYNDKMVAKTHRQDGMVVSYGTDHKKYNYVKGDVR
jgi:hypothetical protein